jgi:site-specific recombinase XerD
MAEIRWERYREVSGNELTRTWLSIEANLGLAQNTIDAYGRALEHYLRFSRAAHVEIRSAVREHIAAYIHDLASLRNPKRPNVVMIDSGVGLANATLQQRLTAIGLFYDFLIEEGVRTANPVGRGRHTPGKGFGSARDRGLIPRFYKLPWIPNEEEWRLLMQVIRQESIRNRTMLAFGYDGALRREELCALEIGDLNPAHRLLGIRAETTKGRRARVVPYSESTGQLYAAYLGARKVLSRRPGRLFLSESRRNRSRPISLWTWSKVVRGIAHASGVERFTPHSLRHLRLTDLARAGWDIHEIAEFAGHRSLESTMLYIHLSGRELAAKLESGMAQIHLWRVKELADATP